MSVNKVILIGNLGADPEIRQFPNGGMITNVSIATTERWSDKQTGEKKEATEWHRVQFNNRLAEIAQQYLRKGSQVYIEGSIRTRKWQDQNGQDRYSTEIRANSLQMLGGANQSNQPHDTVHQQQAPARNAQARANFEQQAQAYNQQQAMQNPASTAFQDAPADDDIPF